MTTYKNTVVKNPKYNPFALKGKGNLLKTLVDIGKDWNKIKDLFQAKKVYPKSVSDYLNKYGNEKVKTITVCRSPIASGVTITLNALSRGTFNKTVADLGYDKMFHLYMIINGAHKLEKNERVSLTKEFKPDMSDCMKVYNISGNTTLTDFLENTRKAIGDHNMFSYSAFDLNCQRFISDVLRSNGLLTPELQKFILQDAKALVEKLPSFVKWIANASTDLYAKAKELIGGKKRKGRTRV